MTLRVRQVLAVAALIVMGALAASAMGNRDDKSRVFELRTYVAYPGRTEAMHKRFREHTCDLFKKHGMELVGFWTPQELEQGKESTLTYMLAFPSREAARESWAAFGSDPEWIKVRNASEEDGKIVAKVTSVYLDPTDYSPVK